MQKLIILVTLLLSNYFISQAQEADFIIKNVSIVSMKDNVVLNNKTLAVKDGKIIEIADKLKIKAKETIDAKGKFIMPSLSDAHVHFPSTEEELENVMKLNLINGVTKLRSMRGDWKHYDWRAKYNTKDSFYPRLYLSAPPISRNVDWTTAEIEDFVKAAKERNIDFETFSEIFQSIMSAEPFYSSAINIAIQSLLRQTIKWDEYDTQIVLFLDKGIQTKYLPQYINLSLSTIEKRKATLKNQILDKKATDNELIEKCKLLKLI